MTLEHSRTESECLECEAPICRSCGVQLDTRTYCRSCATSIGLRQVE